MKKENRKLAQQRRAEERKKQESKKKLQKILWITIPSAAALILIIAITISAVTSPKGESSVSADGTSAGQTSGSDADTDSNTPYSTDTSLTVKDGDTVNIDYVGSIGGEEFSGGSTNGAGADLTIGSGRYIDDFEEQLIGSHPGDHVEVNVTFPEDYYNEDLQGKDALFQVTVNGIYEAE